jgi:Protein of unknown function (DUF2997)
VADKTELEITIGPDGEVHIVTHGLKGQACLAETKELETAVGEVKRREKTREFYQQEARTAAKVRN